MRLIIFLILTLSTFADVKIPHPNNPIFNMNEIMNASTLETEIIQDWHLVNGPIKTRQKYVIINVGEFWPGQDYRVPLRFVVPANQKAKGFHLTGGNRMEGLSKDFRPRGVDLELLKNGVGLVMTIVQEFGTWGKKALGDESKKRFAKSLNPKVSIQYWAWPASLMRAVTAAYAEKAHFEKGKVLISGGSKNGASPSVSIIHDPRITAVHATVSPICESPLRLCQDQAWEDLKKYYQKTGAKSQHRFLGGIYGPIYNDAAMEAGNSWIDLQNLAKTVSPYIFISLNWDQLMARGCELYFHPGTHDFVAFDMPSLGKNYPQIPTYNRVNSGHGKKSKGAKVERLDATKSTFIRQHFLTEGKKMLLPPKVKYQKIGNALKIEISFSTGQQPESGRIFWMYDRPPEGTIAYIKEDFPVENFKEMIMSSDRRTFSVQVPLKSDAKYIDFFSNHRKTVELKGKKSATHISSPYTRIKLK